METARAVLYRKAVVQGCNLPRATKQPSIFQKTSISTSNILAQNWRKIWTDHLITHRGSIILFLQLNSRRIISKIESPVRTFIQVEVLNSLITSLHRNPRRRKRVFIFMERFIFATINVIVYIPDWSSARSSKTCKFIDFQGSAGNLNKRYNNLICITETGIRFVIGNYFRLLSE